ncbi:glycosyltransferase family 1 protein [Salinicola endophyticus]|uniref:Glycosyltransferase family 1 protein n=1 Tax=Salinicola endophyticus TaxID=1949083 RepID=A0ABY8FIH7_9GAMM|nr:MULTISPECIES: glycosyltransferase family 1 protein [Salinicola]WFF42427.1 glycosyltransferase family 1 protein [Salinicola endophyticus]
MHIADVTMFYAPASGGVRTYLDAKHRRLAKLPGVTCSLLIPGAELVSHDGVHEVPSPPLPFSQGYRFPLRRRGWERELLRVKPDIIEAGDPYVTGWAALDAGRKLDVPVVGFYHSDLPRLISNRLGSGTDRLVERYVYRLYRRFDQVLAPSRVMAERLTRLGIEHVAVQPLGVDLESFHPRFRDPALRTKLGLDDDTKLLIFVGRGSREKNLHHLLEMARQLGKGYHLLLVGPSMPSQTPDNVSVIDRYTPTEEVAGWLASSDALVHAGTQETFGLVALEAMASGIPVIAARAGALAENVPLGCGLLSEPHSPADMARAVRELFTQHDAEQAGRRARRYVERHHDWDIVIDGLLTHYRRLTSATASAGAAQHGSQHG